MDKFKRISLNLGGLVVLVFCFTFGSERCNAQRIVVPARAEGAYWLVRPKPWFTRLVCLSTNNRTLPKDDHDESLPTLPGYFHRTKEGLPFTRYPFSSIVVRKGRAAFTTRIIKGQRFVFSGRWGTEFDERSNIENVPYLRGTLLTYRKGKLVKRERVYFSHAVNA